MTSQNNVYDVSDVKMGIGTTFVLEGRREGLYALREHILIGG